MNELLSLILTHFSTHSQVLLPLAKCLDNVIRFQILSPRDSSSTATGEVSILTEPKMLPLPSTAFLQQHDQGCSSHSTRRRKSQAGFVGAEEGWEDGEDLGPDDRESEQSENEIHQSDSTDSRDEGGESWLEGRFQRSVQQVKPSNLISWKYRRAATRMVL